MINLELLEQVIDTSNKSKLIDKKLIRDIGLDAVERSDDLTKSHFNELSFGRIDEKNATGECAIEKGEMVIDYNNWIIRSLHINFKNNQDILFYNLDMVRTMIHEVNHLREYSARDNDDIESILLALSSHTVFELLGRYKLGNRNRFASINKVFSAMDKIYTKLYSIIPDERLAEIYAYKEIFESLKSLDGFKEKYDSMLADYYRGLILEYHVGYKLSNSDYSPTMDYLNRIIELGILRNKFYSDKIDRLKTLLNEQKGLNVEEKMRYGLPVEPGEKKELKKIITYI